MLQVTMDLETQLYDLETARTALVKQRDAVIAYAERMIAEANRDFDEVALTLGREINELRERLKRDEKPADKRSHKAPTLDGLDDDDAEHFQELLARRKKR